MEDDDGPRIRVGARIADVRQRKGWSQADLSEQLEREQVRIDRTTIARMEHGKRRVSVDDLFALAAALEVSPMTLALPNEDTAPVAVTPARIIPAAEARRWAIGETPLPGQPGDFFRAAAVPEEWVPVRRTEVRGLAGLVDALEAAFDREDPKAARLALVAAEHEVEQLRTAVKTMGRRTARGV